MDVNPPVALLDACVLYPYTLRDTLMYLAVGSLYHPRWTQRINKEWMKNLLAKSDNKYTPQQLQRTVDLMNSTFELGCIPESLFLDIIPTLDIPDPNGRHVLAAAIAGKVDILVTSNLSDFPPKKVNIYGVMVVSPDDFILDLAKQHLFTVIEMIKIQSTKMKKWPKTPLEIVETLDKCGLKKTCQYLAPFFKN